MLLRGGALEHIGLQQDELHPGQGLGDLLEHALVDPAELGGVHAVVVAQLVPHVVDADHNADHIGAQVDAVHLDAGVQVHHPVAGDAPVQKFIAAGFLGAELGGSQQGVSHPQHAVGGGLALLSGKGRVQPSLHGPDHVRAVHVGDGIPGE